jgi:uncharacterized protein (UPF0548 family)
VPLAPMSAELAHRLERAELTYPEVGQTQGALPAGYRLQRRTRVIGSGADVFEAAAAALTGWHAHERAGLRVCASRPAAEPGTVVVLTLRAGPMRVRAPSRVVYTIDVPHRRGFAYGTLPGHPESGEELFVVSLHDDGEVTATVTAFSRPASLAARAAGPFGAAVQSHLTNRYLRALALAAAGRLGVHVFRHARFRHARF